MSDFGDELSSKVLEVFMQYLRRFPETVLNSAAQSVGATPRYVLDALRNMFKEARSNSSASSEISETVSSHDQIARDGKWHDIDGMVGARGMYDANGSKFFFQTDLSDNVIGPNGEKIDNFEQVERDLRNELDREGLAGKYSLEISDQGICSCMMDSAAVDDFSRVMGQFATKEADRAKSLDENLQRTGGIERQPPAEDASLHRQTSKCADSLSAGCAAFDSVAKDGEWHEVPDVGGLWAQADQQLGQASFSLDLAKAGIVEGGNPVDLAGIERRVSDALSGAGSGPVADAKLTGDGILTFTCRQEDLPAMQSSLSRLAGSEDVLSSGAAGRGTSAPAKGGEARAAGPAEESARATSRAASVVADAARAAEDMAGDGRWHPLEKSESELKPLGMLDATTGVAVLSVDMVSGTGALPAGFTEAQGRELLDALGSQVERAGLIGQCELELDRNGQLIISADHDALPGIGKAMEGLADQERLRAGQYSGARKAGRPLEAPAEAPHGPSGTVAAPAADSSHTVAVESSRGTGTAVMDDAGRDVGDWSRVIPRPASEPFGGPANEGPSYANWSVRDGSPQWPEAATADVSGALKSSIGGYRLQVEAGKAALVVPTHVPGEIDTQLTGSIRDIAMSWAMEGTHQELLAHGIENSVDYDKATGKVSIRSPQPSEQVSRALDEISDSFKMADSEALAAARKATPTNSHARGKEEGIDHAIERVKGGCPAERSPDPHHIERLKQSATPSLYDRVKDAARRASTSVEDFMSNPKFGGGR